jgi:uracil-DNA glycosylase
MLKTSLTDLITEPSWKQALRSKVTTEAFTALGEFLNDRISQQAVIYPEQEHWFRAINQLPLAEVKVVIVGQDPYHGEGQANGLSFSVPSSEKVPPSLRNIFKEIAEDCGIHNQSGDLSAWLSQGVLLINATLTVEQGQAGSHQNQGWEEITDAIIALVSQRQSHCVFMLWGSFAQQKATLVDANKHLILTAPHPSPLSAYRGWFGCQHFSKANAYLERHLRQPIRWQTDDMHQESLL